MTSNVITNTYKYKSSYLFSCISHSDVIQLPNIICVETNRMYAIKQHYSETNFVVYSAVVFINCRHLSKLLEYPTKPSSYLHRLRNHAQLKDINGIEDLDISHYLSGYMYQLVAGLGLYQKKYDDIQEYVILNIEPKATTAQYILRYPIASITIPGGHIEEQDQGKFLVCARREFQEETRLQIQHLDILSQYIFKKDYLLKGTQFKMEVSTLRDPHITDITEDKNMMMAYIFVAKLRLKHS